MNPESAKSIIRVVLAEGISKAFVAGIGVLADMEMPLTERQKSVLMGCALDSYRQAANDGENAVDTDEFLLEWRESFLEFLNQN